MTAADCMKLFAMFYLWALRAIFLLNSYVLCPAVNIFAPRVGFAGYVWFGLLFARLRNVCPLFVWALRAVLFRMFFALLLTVCPFLWAWRAKISFALLFALLLRVCPLLMWALRVVLISYVVWFAVNILPHSSVMRAITWLFFTLLAAFSPFSYRLRRPFYYYYFL